MKEIIKQLYPQHLDEVLLELDKLLKRYDFKENSSEQVGLSEKDSILITYGDAIFSEGESTLATLKRFASRHLKGKISAIHLLPCFPYTSDDGFSVTDYYRINPDLGDWEDIASLEQHFELMFDAVVNHISQESEWFKAFLRGEEPYVDYFIEAEPDADYSAVVRPRALPLLHDFKKQGKEVHIWTTFSRDQVDLNYSSYKVFLQVLDVLLFYVSKGAKFIRLDAIAFLWKKLGTPCIHLKETHLVIQAYRKILDLLPVKTYLITETNVPHKENISYFGDGYNEAHMVYNFTLPPLLALAIHRQSPKNFANWARSLSLPSDGVCFFNFTASHDGVGVRPLQGIVPQEEIDFLAEKAEAHGGFVSFKDNGDGTKSPYELNCNYMDLLTSPDESTELRIQRFLLSQSVMLCMPGVPGVYYHSLLGSENDREAAISSGINRRINRAKLQFTDLEAALTMKSGIRSSIFHLYSKMLEVRAKHGLFHPTGKAEFLQNDALLTIKRQHADELLYAVHNFGAQEVPFDGPNFRAEDLLEASEIETENLVLKPFEFLWLKKI